MNPAKTKFISTWGFGFILFMVASLVSLQSGLCALNLDEVSGGDVTLSEYDPTNLSLVIQIHATRLFTDYEHRGFFRIGLLPVPVAKQVQIALQSTACLTNALFMLQDWKHPALGARRMEFRDLQIFLLGENQPRLRATIAHVGKNGALELSGATVTDLAGKRISLPHATLQVTGKDAGRLFWNSNDRPQELFPLKIQTSNP
jgi:hypothetical protein